MIQTEDKTFTSNIDIVRFFSVSLLGDLGEGCHVISVI